MDLAEALRKRLEAQADIFASLTGHTTITGTGRERALSSMLRELLPKRFDVLTGSIALDVDGTLKKSPRQFDLMVVDVANFPVLARDGDMAIVLPDSVIATVETKSSMSGAVEFLKSIKQVGRGNADYIQTRGWTSFVFSYEYPKTVEDLKTRLDEVVAERSKLAADLVKARAVSDARVWALTVEERSRRRENTERVLAEILRDMSELQAAVLPDVLVCADGPVALKGADETGASIFDLYMAGKGSAAALVLVAELLEKTLVAAEQQNPGTPMVAKLKTTNQLHGRFMGSAKTSANLRVKI